VQGRVDFDPGSREIVVEIHGHLALWGGHQELGRRSDGSGVHLPAESLTKLVRQSCDGYRQLDDENEGNNRASDEAGLTPGDHN